MASSGLNASPFSNTLSPTGNNDIDSLIGVRLCSERQ
jgi:hypothetical protein